MSLKGRHDEPVPGPQNCQNSAAVETLAPEDRASEVPLGRDQEPHAEGGGQGVGTCGDVLSERGHFVLESGMCPLKLQGP